MSRPDFTLTWAGSRLSIPAISAGNYAAGWDTYLGPLPPLGDDHDYVMNLQDRRAVWLGEQMLLAVGHEWQADVSYNAFAVVRSPVNGQLYRSLVGSNLNNEPSVSGSQWALGVTDDTAIKSVRKVFTAGTTYTKPAGLKAAFVEVQAAGGGGGGASAAGVTNGVKCAAGGGSGAYRSGYILAASIGASETITVGAAGSAGSTAGSAGGSGGASSFGSLITCTGGGGGSGATFDVTVTTRGSQPAGVGGTGTGGDSGSNGVSGGVGIVFSGGLGISGSGAGSRLGVGPSGRTEGSNGDSGRGYGAGGAGAVAGVPAGIDTARSGGAGAPGIVVVWEFF